MAGDKGSQAIFRARVSGAWPPGRGRTRAGRGVAGGSPADAIIEVAKDGGYDLIVMGTHGRGRLATALLGSVSNAVAARAGRPVLVVGDGR